MLIRLITSLSLRTPKTYPKPTSKTQTPSPIGTLKDAGKGRKAYQRRRIRQNLTFANDANDVRDVCGQ
jgi:hypothetical protein